MFESHFPQSYGQNRSTFSQHFSYVAGQGMGAEGVQVKEVMLENT